MSAECIKVYGDFAQALINPARCTSPANSESPGCQMLDDILTFVEENPDLVLDMLQLVLMACGLVPGAGEVCDGIDAAISFGRGDWVGGLLSIGAMVPFLGYVATAAKGVRMSDRLRSVMNLADDLARACRRRSSFVPGTPVLMARGRPIPIEAVDVGDRVVATRLVASATAAKATTAKATTAVISSRGAKMIVDIRVDVDGDRGSQTATLSATDNHPFWLPQLRSWVPAAALVAGVGLGGAGGTSVRVVAVRTRHVSTRVHNLAVADFHTYYVLAGDTPILTHNHDSLSRAEKSKIKLVGD